MHHTSPSYDHNFDGISLGDLPSNREYVLSPGLLPGQVKRTSDQPRYLEMYNVARGSIDKKSLKDDSPEQQVPTVDKKKESMSDDDSYFSLKRLRERRRGQRVEDSGLSRRVKQFYKDQDELIDVYERVHLQGTGDGTENDLYKKNHENVQKMSLVLTKVSLAANICLFILKIAAAVVSKSLSVISSVVDSAVDLATSVILYWTWRAIKKRDKYLYPQGRTRLEPVAIIILSVIMCAASVLVIYESIDTISNDSQVFIDKNTTRTLAEIDMSAFPISTMIITAFSKLILFFLCHRVDTPTMSALAEDHRNDVVSNIVALFCGLIGSFAYKSVINPKAIFVDPVGAVLISIYIIIMWIRQANNQIKRLSGHTAEPKFLSQITWITYNHSPLILKIDTVRAFYFGSSYLVEVDIVLPEDMLLKQAHDIGEALQTKIEDLPEVERAFVHIDYEYGHNPSIEHKVV